ncbi:hypothetical protein, partial [Comamonas jiangduensis]|uniref:hypothetical protein n=1 Tax=Comamonas jiangduensis TaxID=1194168 RepID=UPI0028AE27B6
AEQTIVGSRYSNTYLAIPKNVKNRQSKMSVFLGSRGVLTLGRNCYAAHRCRQRWFFTVVE